MPYKAQVVLKNLEWKWFKPITHNLAEDRFVIINNEETY